MVVTDNMAVRLEALACRMCGQDCFWQGLPTLKANCCFRELTQTSSLNPELVLRTIHSKIKQQRHKRHF
jgi:hypothetical protein